MEEFKCPSGVGFPPSVPRAAGHLFFGYRKIAKKYGYRSSTGANLFFAPNFQIQAAIRDHREMENLLCCPFWFYLFWASYLFRSFFALIRVTLGFFVVFPIGVTP